MWQHLQENGTWQGEVWNRKKNGELYAEWLSISTVRDQRSHITQYVGVFYDVTERKQYEANEGRV